MKSKLGNFLAMARSCDQCCPPTFDAVLAGCACWFWAYSQRVRSNHIHNGGLPKLAPVEALNKELQVALGALESVSMTRPNSLYSSGCLAIYCNMGRSVLKAALKGVWLGAVLVATAHEP